MWEWLKYVCVCPVGVLAAAGRRTPSSWWMAPSGRSYLPWQKGCAAGTHDFRLMENKENELSAGQRQLGGQKSSRNSKGGGGVHPRMPLIKVSRRGKELKEAQKNEETR